MCRPDLFPPSHTRAILCSPRIQGNRQGGCVPRLLPARLPAVSTAGSHDQYHPAGALRDWREETQLDSLQNTIGASFTRIGAQCTLASVSPSLLSFGYRHLLRNFMCTCQA